MSDNEGVRILLAMLGMDTWPQREPRYNIAPTQTVDVVGLAEGTLQLLPMSWGVSMPAKGRSGQAMIRRVSNARDDKLWSSWLWRNLIPTQRVLIPVNGFYEWQRKNRKPVQAWSITPAKTPAMFLAGLYARPADPASAPEVSIITTSANEPMSAVHDRMPVIMGSANEATSWLQDDDRASLDALIQPAGNDDLVFSPVSNHVNKSSNAGPACVEPVTLPSA